jgi:hypothetical protein
LQDTALSKLQGRDASEIRDSLPQSFPLKEQFADQGKVRLKVGGWGVYIHMYI